MSKGRIIVTGGCGYIGSHTLVDLIENGYEVVSIDNNIRSNPKILNGVEKITGVKVENFAIDLADRLELNKYKHLFEGVDGIIHFAALKSVEESVQKPLLYHQNNTNSTLNVLEMVERYSIPSFVFSSSCSVYGNASILPVDEDTPFGEAESPYARTKQIGELMLRDFAKANTKTNVVILRYFNPAGAHPSAEIGEYSHGKPIYLVPVIMDVASGKRDQMVVYGTDYPTRDGSCVRDFIHILDLANAHTKAIKFAKNNNNQKVLEVFNLGLGKGVTVLEAISSFEISTKVKLNFRLGNRRKGDVIEIYSNNQKAIELLEWSPKYQAVDIMKTAWDWENSKNYLILKTN